MSYRSAGLRTFGLCLVAALGLLSILAAAAQAGPDWLRKNGAIDELLPGAANFIVTPDVTLAVESKVAGIAVKISCEKTEVDSGNLEVEGKASGTYLFSGCSTFLNGVVSAACKPTGQPISVKFVGQAFEHSGAGYLLILPAAGETFATISFGAECPIGEKISLKGSMDLEDCKNDFANYLVKHLLQEATEGLFTSGAHIDALKFGANAARLAGSEWYELFSGREWKWMA